MTLPFAWFDNVGAARSATSDFLQNTFGWALNDIGPMTFLTADGAEMPFAATCDAMEGVSGWIPYIEVEDLPAATENARKNGAKVIAENLVGPAGTATFLTDPGGAPLALWKRGEAM